MDATGTTDPVTALEDRKYLGWDIPKYRGMAEAIRDNCFLNKQGNKCNISKAKLKKLKNVRYSIVKDPKTSKSLIFKALVTRIDHELSKRQHLAGPERKRP